jgi:taurine transport system permease protein
MTDVGLEAEKSVPTTTSSPKIVVMGEVAKSAGNTVLISITTTLVLLALWALTTSPHLVSPLFRHPMKLRRSSSRYFRNGYTNATLGEHLSASLFRMLVAVGIALILAVPIGLTMGVNRWAKGIFDPPIEFYWPLPPLAYLPLMIIWPGIGETSKIALLSAAMFAPICLSACAPSR